MKQDNNNISDIDFTQGKYAIIFPDEMDADEIDMIKKHLFNFLSRHSCSIQKVETKDNQGD